MLPVSFVDVPDPIPVRPNARAGPSRAGKRPAQEIIASVKRGIYCANLGGGQVEKVENSPARLTSSLKKRSGCSGLNWQQLSNSGGFAFHIAGQFPGLNLAFWAIRG